MKKLFKSACPLMVLIALFWTGCSDDDDPVTDSSNLDLPSIEIGESALKQGVATDVVTLLP